MRRRLPIRAIPCLFALSLSCEALPKLEVLEEATALDEAVFPRFLRAPSDRAVIRSGQAAVPVFMADPCVVADEEGYHLFYTQIFCKKGARYWYAWDPSRPADSNIMDTIGATGYAFSRDKGLTWTFHEEPVILPGPEMWDREKIETPSVIRRGDRLILFYCAVGHRDGKPFKARYQIGVAELDLGGRSIRQAFVRDGERFRKRPGPLLPFDDRKRAFNNNTQEPSVIATDDGFELFYIGLELARPNIAIGAPGQAIRNVALYRATLDTQLRVRTNPARTVLRSVNITEVHHFGGRYHLFGASLEPNAEFHHREKITYYTSVDGKAWSTGRTIVHPGTGNRYDNWGIMAPTVTVDGDTVVMFYSAWERRDGPCFPVPADGRFGCPVAGGKVMANVARAISRLPEKDSRR